MVASFGFQSDQLFRERRNPSRLLRAPSFIDNQTDIARVETKVLLVYLPGVCYLIHVLHPSQIQPIILVFTSRNFHLLTIVTSWRRSSQSAAR